MKLCLISTTMILINGCTCEERIVKVPQKCYVPHTQQPTINNVHCDDSNYSCIVSKALLNYESMRSYAKELEANSKVCQ